MINIQSLARSGGADQSRAFVITSSDYTSKAEKVSLTKRKVLEFDSDIKRSKKNKNCRVQSVNTDINFNQNFTLFDSL